jgi:hypothetical protein
LFENQSPARSHPELEIRLDAVVVLTMVSSVSRTKWRPCWILPIANIGRQAKERDELF